MDQLVPDPFERFGMSDNPLVPKATLEIYQYIDELLGRKAKDTNINRASAASSCYLKRWYQRNGFEGETLTPRVIVNFTLGDLTEHVMKYFISKGCVGPGKLYSEVDFGREVGRFTIQNGKEIIIYDQEDLTAHIGDIEVSAHIDGLGKRNSDGKWELIEVKSASEYGFENFIKDGPGEYLKQATVCMQTSKLKELEVTEVRYFYLKKNIGTIYDRLFDFDLDLALTVATEYKMSNQKEKPIRPYDPKPEAFRGKPTGRSILQYPCTYCGYRASCFDGIEGEFKSGRPIYVVKE